MKEIIPIRSVRPMSFHSRNSMKSTPVDHDRVATLNKMDLIKSNRSEMAANFRAKSPIQLEMRLDPDKLRAPFRKLRKSLKKASKNLTPKQVHRLRTRIRRVQTVIDALRVDKTPEGKKTLDALKSLYKKAGKVRDMDVEIGLAGTLALGAEDPCFIQIVEYLASRRLRFADKLHHALKQRKKQTLDSLWTYKSSVEKVSDTSQDRSWQSRKILADASAFARGLATELTLWPPLTSENLHSYRRKSKKLREILQATGADDRKLIDDLGEVKDSIGAWHDWNELAVIVSKKLPQGAQCKLSRQVRAAEREHWKRALAQTMALRKKYFAREIRVAHAIAPPRRGTRGNPPPRTQ